MKKERKLTQARGVGGRRVVQTRGRGSAEAAGSRTLDACAARDAPQRGRQGAVPPTAREPALQAQPGPGCLPARPGRTWGPAIRTPVQTKGAAFVKGEVILKCKQRKSANPVA